MNKLEGQRVSRIFYCLCVFSEYQLNCLSCFEACSLNLTVHIFNASTLKTHPFLIENDRSYTLTIRRSIDVRAMTLANKFSRCFSVSNIRRQPLMTWKLVYATIFSFYFHLQAKKLKLQKELEQGTNKATLTIVDCCIHTQFNFDIFTIPPCK